MADLQEKQQHDNTNNANTTKHENEVITPVPALSLASSSQACSSQVAAINAADNANATRPAAASAPDPTVHDILGTGAATIPVTSTLNNIAANGVDAALGEQPPQEEIYSPEKKEKEGDTSFFELLESIYEELSPKTQKRVKKKMLKTFQECMDKYKI